MEKLWSLNTQCSVHTKLIKIGTKLTIYDDDGFLLLLSSLLLLLVLISLLHKRIFCSHNIIINYNRKTNETIKIVFQAKSKWTELQEMHGNYNTHTNVLKSHRQPASNHTFQLMFATVSAHIRLFTRSRIKANEQFTFQCWSGLERDRERERWRVRDWAWLVIAPIYAFLPLCCETIRMFSFDLCRQKKSSLYAKQVQIE